MSEERSMRANHGDRPTTLGELKSTDYVVRGIRDEIRDNLLQRLASGDAVFQGIHGYEDTVFPQVERAVLARHNINFLGLRGQAKTRMARQLTDLLDEYVPAVAGSPIHDDPLQPLSRYAQDLIAERGDDTPIEWIHRSERYTEKLATPDVSVADLVGDTDPIKAANLKLDYSDERVIHFGLIPRAHRGIFVINELPDLQPRIQVALFNILQEGDIQIRGFKLRLHPDVLFVFTANPEDYTHRGAIITPLKDRIQSQILTHYPDDIEVSAKITAQEAELSEAQKRSITVPTLVAHLIEQIAVEARNSEYVDQKSGVSARLGISAYELLAGAVERRMLRNGESEGVARVGDLAAVVPAITGKVELVYEGEQEGAKSVAYTLINRALRHTFARYLPNPDRFKKNKEESSPFDEIVRFVEKNEVELPMDLTESAYQKALEEVTDLKKVAKRYFPGAADSDLPRYMELILHGLAEFSLLTKSTFEQGYSFESLLTGMFSNDDDEEDRDMPW